MQGRDIKTRQPVPTVCGAHCQRPLGSSRCIGPVHDCSRRVQKRGTLRLRCKVAGNWPTLPARVGIQALRGSGSGGDFWEFKNSKCHSKSSKRTEASMSSGSALWLPIATFVGGSGVTLGVEYLRSLTARADRQQVANEAKEERVAATNARSDERMQRLADEHRARQRDALTELQERLSDYMRANGRAHHADEMAWDSAGRDSENGPATLLPSDLSDELNSLQRRIAILAERVDDGEVRRLVREIVHAASGLAMASRQDAKRLMEKLITLFQRANERIGEQLRELPPF